MEMRVRTVGGGGVEDAEISRLVVDRGFDQGAAASLDPLVLRLQPIHLR